MKMEKICINCPAGCRLTIETTVDGSVLVTGNRCPRGKMYGISEAKDPRRTVTAVAPTEKEDVFVPVRSSEAVPLNLISAMLLEIYALKVKLPVNTGDVLIRNFHNTGIDVTATRDMQKKRIRK